MIRIYFSSGKELEFDYDWNQLAPKFQLGGIRMFKTPSGDLIPLNSATIERIQYVETEEDILRDEIAEVQEDIEEIKEEAAVEKANETTEDKADKKSAQERADEMLAHMKEMSECTHEEHEIYYSESTIGKSRKPVKRYFPVCAKCGVREKFVKSDLLPDEVKEAAKLWDK
jgi:hypothetical protein